MKTWRPTLENHWARCYTCYDQSLVLKSYVLKSWKEKESLASHSVSCLWQVIAVLLEEDRVATQPRWNLRSRQTSLSISDSCFQLNTNLPFLHGKRLFLSLLGPSGDHWKASFLIFFLHMVRCFAGEQCIEKKAMMCDLEGTFLFSS